MRFLLPLPARSARRRLLGGFAAVLVAFTTACDWITGIPTVLPTIPAQVIISQTSVPTGETVALPIQVLDLKGQIITGRKAKVTSSNPSVLTIVNNGTTADVEVTGLQVGTSTVTVDVDGR